MATPPPGARFLTLVDVAEVLNTSSAQVYALVRGGDLPAIKIGGRGQWRVESSELEKYIQRMYEQTRDFVSTHRFGRPEGEAESNEAPEGSVGPEGEPVGGPDG
jgi:excisionase family DNA binding protein